MVRSVAAVMVSILRVMCVVSIRGVLFCKTGGIMGYRPFVCQLVCWWCYNFVLSLLFFCHRFECV